MKSKHKHVDRFTVYVGEPLAAAMVGFESARSARVNLVADAYRAFVEDNTPALPVTEWCAVVDAANGYVMNDMAALGLLWATISDSAEDGVGEKWGVDVESLAQRVRRMRASELLALREIIARFNNATGESYEAKLRHAGARFAEE